MLFWITLVVITALITWFAYKEEINKSERTRDMDNVYIAGIFGCIFTFIIAGAVFVVLSAYLETKYVKYENRYVGAWHLVNLEDNIGTQGTFYARRGTVDNQSKYFFYYKENGAKILQDINAHGVPVFESNDHKDDPRIEAYQDFAVVDEWYSFWFFDFYDKKKNRTFKVMVPPGTIKEGNFNMDLK